MSLADWSRNGWVPHQTSASEIADLFAVVERDLADSAARKKRNIGGYERAGMVSDREAREMRDLARKLRPSSWPWRLAATPSPLTRVAHDRLAPGGPRCLSECFSSGVELSRPLVAKPSTRSRVNPNDQFIHGLLGVSSDRDDRDLLLAGAMVPEDSIRSRRTLLRVGLEDLRPSRPGQRLVLVGLEALVARVSLQVAKGFANRLEPLFEASVAFELFEIGLRLLGKDERKSHPRRQRLLAIL